MKKMIEYSHMFLADYITDDSIGIDFTMGQGNDTLFLARRCKEVYAFDIQEEAYQQTIEKTNDLHHVHCILDSHENFDQYIQGYDVGIFNLGYLPQGQKMITTMLSSTKAAVEKAVEHLNKKGILILVCYVGHPSGKEEADYLDDYIKTLDPHYLRTFSFRMENVETAPFILGIERIRNI